MTFEVLGVTVSLVAISLAVVLNMVLGMLWYGDFLFGKYWLKLVGKKAQDLKMKPTDMLLAIVVAGLTAIGINSILQFSRIVGGLDVIPNIVATAGMVALTITATSGFNEVIWEGRNIKLFLFNLAYHFVNYVLMGAVISYFVY